MTFKSSDIGKINPEEVEKAEAVFKGLDKDILSTPDHPLAAEYERISADAKSVLQRIAMAMGIPSGYAAIEQGAEKLGELYARAIEIRSQISQDRMRREFGVAANGDIGTALEPMVEKATGPLGAMGASLVPKFQQVIATLGMDFSADPQKALIEIGKSRKFLEEVRTAAVAAPELAALANRMSTGLDRMAAINPTIGRAVAHDQWYAQNFSGKRIDTKPLRIAGALVGSFILTLNLAHAAWTKTNPVTPVTAGWGLATMLFANPKLLQSSSSRTLESLAAMGSPEVQHAYAQGFHGPLAGQALEELQSLRSSKRTELAALQKSDKPLTMAQIGQVAGEGSALTQMLSGMPANERAAALRTFGSRTMNADAIDVAKTLLA